MMHFSCDICGKDMLPGNDPRFVVKIEAFAAHDPATLSEADLEEDNMQAVSQILRDCEETGEPELPPLHKNFRFDLCPDCHERFVRDPLGKEQVHKLFFISKN